MVHISDTVRAVTHRCAIEACPIEVPASRLMCAAHWRLVPGPIQQDVYALCRTRRGSPAHRAAVARAIHAVRETLAGRERKRAETMGKATGWLPYRDD